VVSPIPAASRSAINSCNRPFFIASDNVNMLKILAESAVLCNMHGGGHAEAEAILNSAA
jgi:hypothetical protein